MIVNGIDISDCPFIDNDEKKCPLGCLTENCLYQQKCEILKGNNKHLRSLIEKLDNIRYRDIKRIEKYKQAIKDIEGIVSEPCGIAEKTCKECNSNCEHKDILNIIKKVGGQ